MFSATSSVPRSRRLASIAFVGLLVLPALAAAQPSTTFTACTQGALANCSVIRLTSQLGVGLGGTNLFEIALRNLGSQSTPTLATSIYTLVFSTRQNAAPGAELDTPVSPAAEGSATVSDATAWDVFDSGDAIFLSAVAANGVGNCVVGSAFGGFSQSGNTCGDDTAYLGFSFFTTRAYDPTAFTLLDLEVVGLTDRLPADNCNDAAPCAISTTPVTATPEPGTLALAMTGLIGVIGLSRRRRSRGRASAIDEAPSGHVVSC